MRKFSVRFTILCILALLVGVTALAVSGTVSNLSNQDANAVEVKLNDGEAPTFTITRKNAQKGKLYTVLIRSGAENDKPSGGENGNLVYMDIVEATRDDGTLEITKAYPKEMSAGTYRVFMSEYGTANKIQQVATFQVSGNSNPDNVKLGFVVDQSNDDITGNDVLYALYISVGKTVNGQEWTDVQRAAANVDGDDNVTGNDVLWILERSVGKRDANWNKVG
ncbi:MAG: hypothetical protein IKO14_10255 [Oscillibacter sp.]|nr:hypothetical protein [Oscillibacter sp.]